MEFSTAFWIEGLEFVMHWCFGKMSLCYRYQDKEHCIAEFRIWGSCRIPIVRPFPHDSFMIDIDYDGVTIRTSDYYQGIPETTRDWLKINPIVDLQLENILQGAECPFGTKMKDRIQYKEIS